MALSFNTVYPVTIPNGAATPAAGVDIQGGEVVAVRTPATLTSTKISFIAANALAGTYLPVYKEDGTLYEVTVVTNAARSTRVDPAVLRGLRFVKPVMGSNEGAQRSLELVVRNP